MTLSEEILEKAVSAGLCEEHTAKWNKKWSADDMLRYYKANPNWCMERQFPPLDMLERYRNHNLNIFVSEDVTLRASDLCYIFVNCNAGVITRNIVRLYLTLDSNAKIVVEDGGDLVVDSFDNTRLNIELRGGARCIVYRHGKYEPEITGSDNYRIRDKRK